MNHHLAFILVPLILSNVLHMFWVKKDLTPGWAVPVWPSLFGANKTWRGFAVLPLLNGLFSAVLSPLSGIETGKGFWIGIALGLAYMLSELPNSWIKRRAGIAPGGSAASKAWFFAILDKTDSSLGISLACHFIFQFSLWQTAQLFLIAVFCHAFFSWILLVLGVKKHF
ncbi:MAG: hypothetical protein DYG98_15185 [Haliscomenobacteraceae bacterium CHB4]|nr:hypothetical protein [Saprospiraceae bacterium]MCE7924389.1 hypothetical protein [Haliscomenobacteraceae bacterium CHB4]